MFVYVLPKLSSCCFVLSYTAYKTRMSDCASSSDEDWWGGMVGPRSANVKNHRDITVYQAALRDAAVAAGTLLASNSDTQSVDASQPKASGVVSVDDDSSDDGGFWCKEYIGPGGTKKARVEWWGRRGFDTGTGSGGSIGASSVSGDPSLSARRNVVLTTGEHTAIAVTSNVNGADCSSLVGTVGGGSIGASGVSGGPIIVGSGAGIDNEGDQHSSRALVMGVGANETLHGIGNANQHLDNAGGEDGLIAACIFEVGDDGGNENNDDTVSVSSGEGPACDAGGCDPVARTSQVSSWANWISFFVFVYVILGNVFKHRFVFIMLCFCALPRLGENTKHETCARVPKTAYTAWLRNVFFSPQMFPSLQVT